MITVPLMVVLLLVIMMSMMAGAALAATFLIESGRGGAVSIKVENNVHARYVSLVVNAALVEGWRLVSSKPASPNSQHLSLTFVQVRL